MDNNNNRMIFTLEEDNDQAPSYENRTTSLDNSLNEIRQRYRRTEEMLAARRSKLLGEENPSPEIPEIREPLNDLPPSPELPEQDFRLPEIDMPPERDYSLDEQQDLEEIDGNLLVQATEETMPIVESNPTHYQDNQVEDNTDEMALSKLFKRYEEERANSPIQPPPEPVLPVVMDDNLSPNEQGYAAYLNYRQREHNQRVSQSAIAENEIGILIQEDWLAAQTAVKSAQKSPPQVVHLQPDSQGYRANPFAADDDTRPVVTVNVYDLPDLPSTRKIRVMSEQELMAELQRKLRPHLSNAVAGLMHSILQRKLATLSYDLQMMLNEETPRLVEDVLEHNMETILREMKERL
ncbi:hypothetical protein [Alysiella crassa]|uniref:Uncharacterized protein n=1 Tax=Alysiella crassa TaxID=153491 RepID=A0A376BWA5_9NEIS|nr:hypothetical protein [Alysiella crassa]UOP06587.1 hypothetical protein LVJ80_12640 [Alysiella crassa]SSY81121.1 Uncharacterised protein [Alysiella crassa]